MSGDQITYLLNQKIKQKKTFKNRLPPDFMFTLWDTAGNTQHIKYGTTILDQQEFQKVKAKT